jgi:hypothetical protein
VAALVAHGLAVLHPAGSWSQAGSQAGLGLVGRGGGHHFDQLALAYLVGC